MTRHDKVFHFRHQLFHYMEPEQSLALGASSVRGDAQITATRPIVRSEKQRNSSILGS